MASRTNIDLTATEQNLFSAIDKLQKANDKLSDQYKKLAQESRKAGKGGKEDVDGVSKSIESGIGTVARWAASFVSVTAVIGLIKKGLDDIQNAQKTAASKMMETELAFSKLAQLASGNAQKHAELIRQSQWDIFAKGGAASQSQSADIIFQIESAGANTAENRELLAQLYEETAGQQAMFAQSARAMQVAMGEKETGSMRDIWSKALAASPTSPAEAPALLQAAAGAAAPGKVLGWTDEQLLAATTVVSKTFGAEEAGTLMRTFARAMMKEEGIGSKPLSEQLQAISSLSEDRQRGIIGDDLYAALQEGLPKAKVRKGKKTTTPFKDSTTSEALSSLGGMKEAEVSEILGEDFAASLHEKLSNVTNFAGMSPMQIVEEIDRRQYTLSEAVALMPRRAYDAYAQLSQNKELTKQVEADIIYGGASDFVSQVASTSERQPVLRGLHEKRVAENIAELNSQGIGITETTATAIQQQKLNEAKEKGVGLSRRLWMGREMSFHRWAGGAQANERFIANEGTPQQYAEYLETQQALSEGRPINSVVLPEPTPISEERRRRQENFENVPLIRALDRLVDFLSGGKTEEAADKQLQAAQIQLEAAKKTPQGRPLQARPATATGVDRG